jgi:signal peptidase I
MGYQLSAYLGCDRGVKSFRSASTPMRHLGRNASAPRSKSGPCHRLVQTAVLLLAIGLIVRTWCVQGLLVSFQVASGSMAPTLLGPHRRVVCGDCGFVFVCSADRRVSAARIVCPNCAYGGNAVDDWPELAGDRLLVDKTSFQLRAPRRWEVVAFRDPQHPGRVVVKRVVGLPGEAIQIRDGDVFADGEIVRKTLAQQRATAVLVHDSRFPPRLDPVAPQRWQAEPNDGRWVVHRDHFIHPEVPNQPSADWLAYVHRRRLPGPREQTEEAPISNRCGYNQTALEQGENLDPATDLMISFRVVRTSGPGELAVRIGDEAEEFEVWIDPHAGRLRVLRNGETVDGRWQVVGGETDLPPATYHLPSSVHVEVSTFDRQLLVALGGWPAIVLPNQRTGRPGRKDSRRLAIGCRGLGIEVGEVRVFRDIYYTQPAGGHVRWGIGEPVLLGRDEYFVLGDNSPVSEDSRDWPEGPALSGGLLIGKPLLVHFPARDARFGGWRFQVPDLSEIRYIR